MFWRRGWLVNSLKYYAEKDLRETLYQNQSFLKNRPSYIERLIIWGAKNVAIANLFLFVAALFILSLASTQYDVFKQYIPASLHGLTSIQEFQETIFVAQITLLGLIFPLVIAFIGILLQEKSSNEAMWEIYRHKSGFMLVGFSALSLTSFFILFKLCGPWLTHQQQTAASFSIANWFMINLFLSGWFLLRTVQFLASESRMEMIVSYAISSVIANDIRKRLLFHHSTYAHKNGLLLNPKCKNIEITTIPTPDLPNHRSYTTSIPKVINNVWYRLLNIGIRIWMIQAALYSSDNKKAVLCIPLSANTSPQKDIVLAKTNTNPINFLSYFFLRFSVRMSEKKELSELNLKKMVGALFAQIEDSLKENNSRLFEAASANLTHFHLEIDSAMSFTNDDGNPDNWLLLSENGFWGRNFLDEFIKESSNISRKITRRIQEDTSYYESWCYFYPNLFSRSHINKPAKITEGYIYGHYLIWCELMSWMGGFNAGGVLESQIRDKAIKHFVGSWEAWRSLISIESNTNDFSLVAHHLCYTSCMLIYASKYDNFDAEKWAIDMLIHWYDLFYNHKINPYRYQWYEAFITSSILNCSEDNPLRAIINESEDLNETDVASIALKNYWTDIRCVTAAYLMGSNKYMGTINYKKYIDALIFENRLEPTGNIEIKHGAINNGSDILEVYLRQSDYWNDNHTYAGVIEQHMRKLSRIEEPEWVSGRIYSFSNDLQETYLRKLYQVIGIGLTNQKFAMNFKWINFLKSDALPYCKRKSTIATLEKLTQMDDTIINLACNQFGIEKSEAEQNQALFIESIDEIIDDLKRSITSQIVDASIDEERLKEIGESASLSTFTLSKGPIPISLFQDIEYVDDFESELEIIKISDYPKSYIAQDIQENLPINEDDWLNNIVQGPATNKTFHQLLAKFSWDENGFEDNLSLFTQAIKDSELIKQDGSTPIMFIGPWSLFSQIKASTWPYANEEETLPFNISIESGKNKSYVCHLSGIEIYQFPFNGCDYSIMLSKEAFKKIIIKRFGDGRYTKASFESNDSITGTLSISFGINCEFDPTPSFKYISLNSEK